MPIFTLETIQQAVKYLDRTNQVELLYKQIDCYKKELENSESHKEYFLPFYFLVDVNYVLLSEYASKYNSNNMYLTDFLANFY